jgi:hypothetical protein
MKKTYTFPLLAVITLIVVGIIGGTNPHQVSAHRSPDECSGSGLQISLFANMTEAHIGDVISYDITVFNGIGSGPTVCEATDISTSLTTPDGIVHPIVLSRTSLTNGQSDTYPNIVTYTARTQDVVSENILKATASITGVIHQNDTDSQGGANQSVNTTVMPDVPVTPTVVTPSENPPTPPSSSSSSSGGCAYGYNFELARCNYTPLQPVITQQIPLEAPIVASFPNTGFGPEQQSSGWYTILCMGILFICIVTGRRTYMYVTQKK